MLKGEFVLERKGKEIQAAKIAYVHKKGKTLLLIAQPQRIDIRNGTELIIKEGALIDSEQTIACFDPFSEPIISEVDGKVY